MGSYFGERRRVLGACGALGLAGALVGGAAIAQGGTAGAQQAITVTAAPGATTVGGPNAANLGQGYVRVTLAAPRGGGSVGIGQLAPGVTPEQVIAADRARPNSSPDGVTIITNQFISPGATLNTTVQLAAGNYVAFGEVGRGNNPPLVLTPFSVGTTAAPGSAPVARARVQMYDHGFRVRGRIRGTGTLRIDNIGNNLHFIVGFRTANARQQRRTAAIFRGDARGRPAGQFASVIGFISPGVTNYVETKLRPGRYVLACFFSDAASGGREHNEFGMVTTTTVR
jgi:hypothetical protein